MLVTLMGQNVRKKLLIRQLQLGHTSYILSKDCKNARRLQLKTNKKDII